MSIDISKLDSFAKEVYNKIIVRHPEWDKYAKVDSYKYPGGECFYLSIEINLECTLYKDLHVHRAAKPPEYIRTKITSHGLRHNMLSHGKLF